MSIESDTGSTTHARTEPSLTVSANAQNYFSTTSKQIHTEMYLVCGNIPLEILKLIGLYVQPVLLVVASTYVYPNERLVYLWEMGVLDEHQPSRWIIPTARFVLPASPSCKLQRCDRRYLLTTESMNQRICPYYSSEERRVVSDNQPVYSFGKYCRWNPFTNEKQIRVCTPDTWDMHLNWCNLEFRVEFRHIRLKHRRRVLANRGHKIPCCVWMLWMDCPRSCFDIMTVQDRAREYQNRKMCLKRNDGTRLGERVRLLMHVIPAKTPCHHKDPDNVKSSVSSQLDDSGSAACIHGISNREVGLQIGARIYRLSCTTPSYDPWDISLVPFTHTAIAFSEYQNQLFVATQRDAGSTGARSTTGAAETVTRVGTSILQLEQIRSVNQEPDLIVRIQFNDNLPWTSSMSILD